MYKPPIKVKEALEILKSKNPESYLMFYTDREGMLGFVDFILDGLPDGIGVSEGKSFVCFTEDTDFRNKL
jgi:hypothetical protein